METRTVDRGSSPINPRVVVSWSTGKDSAWCLHSLRAAGEVEVIGLLSSVTPAFDRVSVHGTRLEVLHAQAYGLGLPVWLVDIPYPCSNRQYDDAMRSAVTGMAEQWGPTHVAFGDLCLEDVRTYREERLMQTPLEPLFPLWGRDTYSLAREMLEEGLRAVVVAAPEDSLAADLVGRPWSLDALDQLPESVDRCGENGEFHTCHVGGAGLRNLPYDTGEVVHRDGAVYCDLWIKKK